jgi:hypothetical protein
MSADPSTDAMPSGPSANQIPDIIKIGSVPSDTSIDVETSILEPVSFSQSQCHFVLENKGILHSNSRITLALSNASFYGDADDGADVFYPPSVGVHSMIQRCRLAIGGKTISEIEDYNQYMAYESNFVSPETTKEREQVFSSRIANSVKQELKSRVGEMGQYKNASNNACNNESVFESDCITIDNGRDLDYSAGDVDDGAISLNASCQPSKYVYAWQNLNFSDGEQDQPVFSVLLADLFPFLKMNQLPLYMIDEQVTITLTFVPYAGENASGVTSNRISVTSGQADDTLRLDATIAQTAVKLIADYIYYPQEMMLAYQEANRDMSFTYVDYQFVKRTVTAAAMSAAGGIIQNLGGAGRIVNKVFVGLSQDTGADASDQDDLLNVYHACGPEQSATSAGQVTTNLRYNDLFLYPIDVTNYARHFHNVFSTEGRMPHLPRNWYSGEGAFITSSGDDLGSSPGNGVGDAARCQFEEYGDADGLDAKFFWTAYRLNRNERVNSRGIELYDKRTTLEQTSTLRAYLQVVRLASLREGVFSVTYA